MGDDVKKYIDGRFDLLSANITKNLKWAVGIIVAAMLIIMGWLGTATIKNRMYIKDLEFDIALVEAEQQNLKYKILWMAEVSELIRDYYKEQSDSRSELDFLEQAQRMEDRIMAHEPPTPTFRGDKR